MGKKRKPSAPRDYAREAQERREREQEIGRLEGQGVTVRVDAAKRIVSAYRSNVFNLLLERKTISASQFDAAYRLSLDWAAWKGLDGKAEIRPGRVDESACLSKSLVTDRMITAGRRVHEALSRLTPQHRALMIAFMAASVEEDRPMAWRGIVAKIGVTVRDRQTELVVAALDSLRGAYEEPRTQDRVAA